MKLVFVAGITLSLYKNCALYDEDMHVSLIFINFLEMQGVYQLLFFLK